MEEMKYVINLYIQIINKERRRFPRNFWRNKGKEKLRIILDYIMKEENMTLKDLIKKGNYKWFQNHKLKGALSSIYKNSHINAIVDVFDDKSVHPLDFLITRRNFWTGLDVNTLSDFIRESIKTEFGLTTRKECEEQLTYELIQCSVVLRKIYSVVNNGRRKDMLLDIAFPEKDIEK